MISRRKFIATAAGGYGIVSSLLGVLPTQSEGNVNPTELRAESPAFYWFNSPTISETGNPSYGAAAYENLLPFFTPAKQKNPKVWFVLCDGDCMIETSHLNGYFRSEDAKLLNEVHSVGENLCYVIAVLGQGTQLWQEISRELMRAKTLGYVGMTIPREFNRDSFLACREAMSLVIAARIDGTRFKKVSYGYHSDEQLRRLGFEPYER